MRNLIEGLEFLVAEADQRPLNVEEETGHPGMVDIEEDEVGQGLGVEVEIEGVVGQKGDHHLGHQNEGDVIRILGHDHLIEGDVVYLLQIENRQMIKVKRGLDHQGSLVCLVPHHQPLINQ